MKRYAKHTALALAMALTVTSVAPATASAATKPNFKQRYSKVTKGSTYTYKVKRIKKGTKVQWKITKGLQKYVSFKKNSNLYKETTTAAKTKTTSSNKIYVRNNAATKKTGYVKVTVTGKNGKKYTFSDKIAVKKAAATPTATDTPAPGTDVPAPGTDVPAPATDVPAPGTDVPAPATDVPAPGTDVPAPATDVPAPGTDAPTPTATVAPITAGATATVENSITGYDNVVLVNDNAIITVSVNDENQQPLADKTVVMSLSNEKPNNSSVTDNGIEVKGSTVATTDKNGKASFVVALKKSGLKSTDTAYVNSVQFKATVLGSGTNYTATGRVGFAAITLGNVEIKGDGKNLYPGENLIGNQVQNTYSLNAETSTDVQYLRSQKVSPENTTKSAVTFGVTPKITLPLLEDKSERVDDFVQDVNEKSGTYGTYETKEAIIVLKEDTSALKYATLNFNSIQLSKYTKMTIQSFSDEKCIFPIAKSKVEIEGEKEQSNFAYQIPMTEGSVKAIKVTLESQGQVQTNKNGGFDIKNITGVYNDVTTNGGTKDLTSAKITWSAVTPTFSEDKTLSIADAEKIGITNTAEKSYLYQVPVFPFTGNAVIREYDKNGIIVGYYLAPTVKSNDAKDNTKNTNVLDTTKQAYKATKDEATNIITDGVTTSGNFVTVDSTKVGSTTLQGKISLEGLGSEQLDASNSTVYTSVHWNPITNAQEAVQSAPFLALSGQKITVYAQVTDANGNPVSAQGQDISYTYGNSDTTLTQNSGTIGNTGVSVISKENATDVNGRATLILSAASARSLIGLQAKTSENSRYNVRLYIGNSAVTRADLYWVNPDLTYTNTTHPTTDGAINVSKVTTTTDNDSRNAETSYPNVGTPWQYAVKVVANSNRALDGGRLDGYYITIDGLKINMSQAEGNRGTYDFTTGNGVAVAKSEYANNDTVIARITEDSITSAITFTAAKGSDKLNPLYVGEGAPNINARLTLGVNWRTVGANISLIAPAGTTVARVASGNAIATGTSDIYVKAVDSTGNNVLANQEVTFTSGNRNDELSATGYDAVATSNGAIVVKTDNNGIAKITVVNKEANTSSSIITATATGIGQVTSTTINWINPQNAFGIVSANVSATDSSVVEVRFNNEVNASSVKANEFTLTATDNNGKKVTYEVKSAQANGTKVSLTLAEKLAANEYTIEIEGTREAGISYELTDTYGQKVSDTAKTVKFYSTRNATFGLNYSNGIVNVTDIKSPVDLSAEDFVVTVDGVIVNAAVVVNNDAKTATISGVSANQNQTIRVYYMGTSEGYTVR